MKPERGQPVSVQEFQGGDTAFRLDVDFRRRRRAQYAERRKTTIEVVARVDARRRVRARVKERNREPREFVFEER